MKEIEIQKIKAFAKHMVCPENIAPNLDCSSIGLIDFDNYKFKQSGSKYTGDSDKELLLAKLCESLSGQLESQKTPVLLLSDGKDSMGLALALNKLNIRCKSITLLRKNDTELKEFILNQCSKLGHDPHFVEVDDIIDNFDHDCFLAACKMMDTPVLDQGMIFFLIAMKIFFEKSGLDPNETQFIDGLGNDEHLGYLPSSNQLWSYKFSKLHMWKLNKYLPRFFNWYNRSPIEAQGDLSALSCFFSLKSTFDLNNYFSKIKVNSELDFVDFRAFSRGKFHDHQCMIGKTKVATKAYGASIIYPWTGDKISKYCFNLPMQHKYCFSKLENKIILRELLVNELGWKQSKRGVDLFIDLDKNKFSSILIEYVSPKIIEKITNNKFFSEAVKSRAMLELLNLCGYLKVKGFKNNEIEKFLVG